MSLPLAAFFPHSHEAQRPDSPPSGTRVIRLGGRRVHTHAHTTASDPSRGVAPPSCITSPTTTLRPTADSSGNDELRHVSGGGGSRCPRLRPGMDRPPRDSLPRSRGHERTQPPSRRRSVSLPAAATTRAWARWTWETATCTTEEPSRPTLWWKTHASSGSRRLPSTSAHARSASLQVRTSPSSWCPKTSLTDFVVDGPPGHVVAAGAGETATGGLRIDEPGEYPVYCSVSGHRAAGMEAVLVVTDSEGRASQIPGDA